MFVEHKEALEATEIPAQVTKLSQAIRIGARLRPKCEGQFFSYNGGSCALGAAYEALFGHPGNRYTPNMDGALTLKIARVVDMPFNVIKEVGSGKNDEEDWSREAIADWLEAQGY